MTRTETETTLSRLLEAVTAAEAAERRPAELRQLAEQAEQDARQAERKRHDAEAGMLRGADPAAAEAAIVATEARQRAAERRAAAARMAIPGAEDAALAAAQVVRGALIAAQAAAVEAADRALGKAALGYQRAAAAALAVALADPHSPGAGPGWLHAKLPTRVGEAWGGFDGLRLAGPGAERTPATPTVEAIRRAALLVRRAERLEDMRDRHAALRDAARMPARPQRPVRAEEIPAGDD